MTGAIASAARSKTLMGQFYLQAAGRSLLEIHEESIAQRCFAADIGPRVNAGPRRSPGVDFRSWRLEILPVLADEFGLLRKVPVFVLTEVQSPSGVSTNAAE